MRLRQVVLVARDLEPVEQDLCGVLGIEVCFRDPNVGVFGLKNAVMPVGDTFLEVVSPVTAEATAARYLDRRGGDGGYMVIVQCDDLEADRKRVRELGVRVVWSIDLPEISATHLHPRDVGGAILSLDASRPPGSWLWAGTEWDKAMRTDVTDTIKGVEIQGDDPATLARRWAEVLGQRIIRNQGAGYRVNLDKSFIDFVKDSDGRGEGLTGITVKATDRKKVIADARTRNLPVRKKEVVICGTRIRIA
jgi:hypothetical protein